VGSGLFWVGPPAAAATGGVDFGWAVEMNSL
jgi:hypothetical protein